MRGNESGIRLSAEERKELQELARSRDEPARIAWRAAIVLMSDRGGSTRSIGRALGIGRRTVRYIRQRWRREGYEGLYDHPRCGRPRRADNKDVRLLTRVVQTDPRKRGYCFAPWTAPRLAEYLKQRTAVGMSDDPGRRLLHQVGFVWRKTKLTIRNLQNSREKKGGSEPPPEASGGRFAPGGGFPAVVCGRSPLRSSARDHVGVSAWGNHAAH